MQTKGGRFGREPLIETETADEEDRPGKALKGKGIYMIDLTANLTGEQ